MEGFLIRAAVVAIGLWLASKMGLVAFNSTGTLIAAALLLGVVNAFVRPIIIILTLPITLLTLGLFLLVINALMIMLVAWLVPGFLVAGFWSAVFAAIVVSLTSWVMSGWIGPRGRVEVMTVRDSGRARALVSTLNAFCTLNLSSSAPSRAAPRLVGLIWVFLACGRFAAKAALRSLGFSGFPWILSSETRLINGLRGFFAKQFFSPSLPLRRGTAPAVEAMLKGATVHGASLIYFLIFSINCRQSHSSAAHPTARLGRVLLHARRLEDGRHSEARAKRNHSEIQSFSRIIST